MLKRFLKRVLVFSLFVAPAYFFTTTHCASPRLQESVTQRTYYIDPRDVDAVALLKRTGVLLTVIEDQRKKIFPPHSPSLEDPEKPVLPLLPWYYYCNVRSLQQQTTRKQKNLFIKNNYPLHVPTAISLMISRDRYTNI